MTDTNMLVQSIIGLCILLIITLENLILCRKKTVPVMLLDQIFFGIVVYFVFGWITIIYSFLLTAFLVFIKYRNHVNDGADLDYSGRILSCSAVLNRLHKPKELVIGRVLPVNRNEIKYNMRAIELDNTILSGETFITGSTGSGKNLHKDTIIPTMNGNKLLNDIKIGDSIFDKNGKPTLVVDKYSPKDNKFYKLTLSDGTEIKAGSGHLWEVELLNKRQNKSHLTCNLDEININMLEKCTSDNIISRRSFMLKYFTGNMKYWNTFTSNYLRSFSISDKAHKYISIEKLIAYTKLNLVKPHANKNELNDRIARLINHKTLNNDKDLISTSEAKSLLLTKWRTIVINAGMTLLDFKYAHAVEKDVCAELLALIYDLRSFESLDKDNTQQCKIVTMSTAELVEYYKHSAKPCLAIRRPIACDYKSIELPIKPYWLGAWLGDGSKWEASICGIDLEVGNRTSKDYEIRRTILSEPRKEGYIPITTWCFTSQVRSLLRKNNLRGNKHLPDIYKRASIKDKLELLAGLIDTDGSVDDRGTCSIGMINKQIIENMREICCSLGFECSKIRTKIGSYTLNNERIWCKEFYSFSFFPTIMLPLTVTRKRNNLANRINKIEKNELSQQVRHKRFYINKIEEIIGNYEDYYCLAVDSDTHMFLCTESYVPTHNTTTMKTIIKQRIDEGKPVVFFDYKGEEDILDEIKTFAETANLPYYEFSSRANNFTYDPFINLDETGKVEALMNTRRWSTDGADEHYKTSMQLAIQNLIRNYDLYRMENKETTNYIAGLYEFAKTYHPQSNERDGFNNLLKSLEILLSSKAKLLFGNDPTFTFEPDEPYVICFSFTSSNKALANNISSFVFTDIMDRGTRNKYPDKLLLCVDEFGTLDSSILIKDLLEKGRSGGIQTVFSILDVNQISMNAGEHFVQAILGTINNYIIHAGATQQTAELLAGVQKFDKSYDIMSLRKPYKGTIGTFKPTALFISKYPIFNKKGTQEVYRIAPYSEILKKRTTLEVTDNVDEVEEFIEPISAEELDLSMPIDDVDQYL